MTITTILFPNIFISPRNRPAAEAPWRPWSSLWEVGPGTRSSRPSPARTVGILRPAEMAPWGRGGPVVLAPAGRASIPGSWAPSLLLLCGKLPDRAAERPQVSELHEQASPESPAAKQGLKDGAGVCQTSGYRHAEVERFAAKGAEPWKAPGTVVKTNWTTSAT